MGSRIQIIVDSDIFTTLGELMALFDDITAELAQMQATVGTITATIALLKSQLSAGGMTADQEVQIKDQIDTLQAALNAAAAT